MEFVIDFNNDTYVVVKTKKSLFGNRPLVSAELYYRYSKVHSYAEKKYEGISYDDFKDASAINLARVLLGETFSKFPFIYDDFPRKIEYDYNHKMLLPYPLSRFPVGSTFEVVDYIINKRAEVYYILNNSNEGMVLAESNLLLLFPIIENKYTRSLSYREKGLCNITSRIFGKRFKVIKFGTYYEGKIAEEL